MWRLAPFFNFSLVLFIFSVLFLFKPFFVDSKLPIPSDTIVGLYHPFRDFYAKDYPNGIPYKNFLITDPVRQQYPWRTLAIEQIKSLDLPLWNPYSMGGTPLLGSLQAAAFYPLNVLLFILPFAIGWSSLILLQPLLAGIFSYFYLRNLGLYRVSSILGGLSFAFCGFSVAWLEWGTVGQVASWLPLVLLAIDKLFLHVGAFSAKRKPFIAAWSAIFIGSLSTSFLAGHLQTFFYVALVALLYFFVRWWQFGKSKKMFPLFLLLTFCFLIVTFVQWYPLLQFIGLSARDIDQLNWQQIEGWFIPWQHLIQFVAPDFFGNPATLNYWGTWNYGELVGYIGIVPIVMALYAMFFRREKKTLFFGTLFFLSLIFSLPTIFAELPYILHIPLLSTSQPTRLLFITDFALSVLAAFGIDWYIRQNKKRYIIFPLIFIIGVLIGLWIFVLQGSDPNMLVAKRNLYFPTLLSGLMLILVGITFVFKNKKIFFVIIGILLLMSFVDLLRFAQKFTPFTNSLYLFPQTAVLTFLQEQRCHSESQKILNQVQDDIVQDGSQCQFRIMATDARIMPPNFAVMYHLQSIDGYDPLYLQNYGELIAASERGRPDIHPPFGFNRIITPENVNSPIIDLLGVKYVLSFTELSAPRFTNVFEEGQTEVYKNNNAFPRAFFVSEIKNVANKQEAIDAMFDSQIDLKNIAVVELSKNQDPRTKIQEIINNQESRSMKKAEIVSYTPNQVIIETNNTQDGFLVLTDTFYPTWHAKICSAAISDCQETTIYLTDYAFRGIVVPAGKHHIEFYNSLL